MDPPTPAQPRGRSNRRRATGSGARVSEAPNQVAQIAQQPLPNHNLNHNPSWATSGPSQPVNTSTQHQQHHPAFPSQQLDTRSHPGQGQLADSDGLMNGYTTAPHSQYQTASPLLAHAAPDVTGLGSHNQPANQQAGQQQQQQQQQPSHNQHAAVISASHQRRSNAAAVASQHHHHQRQQQVQPQQHHHRPDDNGLYYNGGPQTPSAASGIQTSSPGPTPYNLTSTAWAAQAVTSNPTVDTSVAASSTMMDQSPGSRLSAQGPPGNLAAPPERIYPSFEKLLPEIQKTAKEQGYNIVKLRASNYRDGKATRYDLVCDRGGVKYASTAKKRTPSTRKVDCPFRAKAVCEVGLDNQWRFVVQESRHNHEARVAVVAPGQAGEAGLPSPVAQSLRTMMNRVDRMAHDMTQGFLRLENGMGMRLDGIEKRLDSLEAVVRGSGLLGANSTPNMGTPSMPAANMGGGGLGNGTLSNGGMGNGAMGGGMSAGGMGGGGMSGGMGGAGMGGGGLGNGMVDNRLSTMEARLGTMERANGMDMPMMDEDSSRLTSLVM